jgi:hypothetical protein
LISGEWVVEQSNARQRRILHYWFTILWFTLGLALWIVLRNELGFVGFMSLYAIWITHPRRALAGARVAGARGGGVAAPTPARALTPSARR